VCPSRGGRSRAPGSLSLRRAEFTADLQYCACTDARLRGKGTLLATCGSSRLEEPDPSKGDCNFGAEVNSLFIAEKSYRDTYARGVVLLPFFPYSLFLGVERAQEISLPRTLCLVASLVRLVFLWRLRVNQVVGTVTQCSRYYEWPFPVGRYLVQSGSILDASEDQVPFSEGDRLDFALMVAS
jgi:hypothetical protein